MQILGNFGKQLATFVHSVRHSILRYSGRFRVPYKNIFKVFFIEIETFLLLSPAFLSYFLLRSFYNWNKNAFYKLFAIEMLWPDALMLE